MVHGPLQRFVRRHGVGNVHPHVWPIDAEMNHELVAATVSAAVTTISAPVTTIAGTMIKRMRAVAIMASVRVV